MRCAMSPVCGDIRLPDPMLENQEGFQQRALACLGLNEDCIDSACTKLIYKQVFQVCSDRTKQKSIEFQSTGKKTAAMHRSLLGVVG